MAGHKWGHWGKSKHYRAHSVHGPHWGHARSPPYPVVRTALAHRIAHHAPAPSHTRYYPAGATYHHVARPISLDRCPDLCRLLKRPGMPAEACKCKLKTYGTSPMLKACTQSHNAWGSSPKLCVKMYESHW